MTPRPPLRSRRRCRGGSEGHARTGREDRRESIPLVDSPSNDVDAGAGSDRPTTASPPPGSTRQRRYSSGADLANTHCVCEFFVVVGYGSDEGLCQALVECSAELRDGSASDSSTTHSSTSASASTSPARADHQADAAVFNIINRQLRVKGEVIDRYPLTPVSSSGTAFPTGIPMFCMPSGLELSYSPPAPSYFCFVTTASSGERLYGHCLTIHDPVPDYVVDAWHMATDHESGRGDGVVAKGSPGSPETTAETKAETIGSITRRKSSKTLFASKCLCLITKFPFLMPCHDFLTALYQISLSHGTVPIERYICNFINEVPLPPPGKAEVQYSIGQHNGEERYLVFRRPRLIILSWMLTCHSDACSSA